MSSEHPTFPPQPGDLPLKPPSEIVTAAFTNCSIRFAPEETPPVSSHEVIFEVPYHHHKELMFIRMSREAWSHPRFDETNGTNEHLPWQSHANSDLTLLTGIDITDLPVTKSIDIQFVPGQITSEDPLTFSLTPLDHASHLLLKNLWIYASYRPTLLPHAVQRIIDFHFDKGEAYASEVHQRYPAAHYWHAISRSYPAGVDYWILSLLQSPAP